MKDYRTLTTYPELETEVIGIYQDFGYALVSSQLVDRIDTDIKQGVIDYLNNGVTVVRTHVSYVKLLFERDHGIPHYEELKELEDEFNAVPYPGDRDKKYTFRQIFWGFMFCTLPGVYMIMHNQYLDRTADEYANALNEFNEKLRLIREKAAAVVRS